jgi:hypothetical protein
MALDLWACLLTTESDLPRVVLTVTRKCHGGMDWWLLNKRPFERLHTAHRAADHGKNFSYAEVLD